ncbi:CemA-like proton extrusion protein-like protein [Actinidia rufa]|uniref:CemA-like proton extrusion protein-like protein n=1 Tax=Actinidia rufa TaxID=165716 RepID=A0A7J0GEE6_9ERIC|nr:CemA-like proton extrusion protein-like protein [Actinidia rufa]
MRCVPHTPHAPRSPHAILISVRRRNSDRIIVSVARNSGLEVEIGKSPPLSDEELWLELQHKALELRDEWRLENRRAFANILSDMVALLKFTGYKILNNISDSGKAFLIILFADIFLGYHSEAGWQTLLEVLIEHYGLEVDQGAITIFIGLVPVFMDLCVKLWLFKILPRLSPRVANILREMKRH